MGAAEPHLRFHRAVRGAIVAEANFDSYREREVGWADVREAWMRPQRNGRPTPWEGLVGRAGARSNRAADVRTVPVDARRSPRDRARPGEVHAEHRYAFLLPAGSIPAQFRSQGALTWEYDGQQAYVERSRTEERGGRWHCQPEGCEPAASNSASAANPARFIGSITVDAAGRRWRLVSVDEDHAVAAIARYDARVRAQTGMDEVAAQPRGRPGPGVVDGPQPDALGGNGFLRRDYWVGHACSGNVGYVIWDASADPLSKMSRPLNERNRKVVFLSVLEPDGTYGGCSGVMVDHQTVLTAAHCVIDDDGNLIDWARVKVMTYGGDDDSVPTSKQRGTYELAFGGVVASSRYEGDSGEFDVAVLTLENELQGDERVGWMPLSCRWDSYPGVAHRIRGYPGYNKDCSYNGSAKTGDRRLWGAYGPVIASSRRELDFEVSHGPGMSGGPYYYCPTGDCEDGQYVTAIHSAHNGQNAIYWWGSEFVTGVYAMGSRAASFRDWVANYSDKV